MHGQHRASKYWLDSAAWMRLARVRCVAINQGPWMNPANRALTVWRIEVKTTLFTSIATLVTWSPMCRLELVPINALQEFQELMQLVVGE